MASYDTNIIKTDTLKQYNFNFTSEKENYGNVAYHIFLSGYLNNCSDPYVNAMTNKLKEKYNQINNGYKNISNWWTSYNDGIVVVEKKLVNEYDGNTGSSTINLAETMPSYISNFNDNLISAGVPIEIINYIDGALTSGLNNNNDEYAKMIIKNLYKIFSLNPDLIIKNGENSEYCPESSTVSIEENFTINNVYSVFYHEITHALDYIFEPEYQVDYGWICYNYQEKAMSNPETRNKLYEYMKSLDNDYVTTWHAIADSEEMQNLKLELRKEASQKDTDSLINDIYEITGLDASEDELGLKDMTRSKLEKAYVKRKRENVIHYLALNESENQGKTAAADLVDSMLQGTGEVNFGDETVELRFGHSEIYFENDDYVYKEQMANFTVLKILGHQDVLDKLKDIYGDEWYNYLDNKYQDYALQLQNMQ